MQSVNLDGSRSPALGIGAPVISEPSVKYLNFLVFVFFRACMVLSSHLSDVSFASTFIQHSSAAIEILKSLSKDCSPGERFPVIESQCERLRMLYRDCAKPPPPPTKAPATPVSQLLF
jgi:E3 ubiquitin-protein ligase HECTD4